MLSVAAKCQINGVAVLAKCHMSIENYLMRIWLLVNVNHLNLERCDHGEPVKAKQQERGLIR